MLPSELKAYGLNYNVVLPKGLRDKLRVYPFPVFQVFR